jgi:hypothetical protein
MPRRPRCAFAGRLDAFSRRSRDTVRAAPVARRFAILAVLLSACSLFLFRGVIRALEDSGDFATPYVAAQAWADGQDPYGPDLAARWLALGGPPSRGPASAGTPSVYPPPTFVPLWPFTFASWPMARGVMLALNVALLAVTTLRVWRLTGSPRGERWWVFLALALAFAPIHTGLAKGNLAIPASCLAILGLCALGEKRRMNAGFLIGAAMLLKPQLAVAALFCAALRRHWSACAIALTLAAAAATLAAAWSGLHHVAWVTTFRAQIEAAAGPGGINDPSLANPSRYQLVNLQMPLMALVDSRLIASLVALCCAGGIAAVAIYSAREASLVLTYSSMAVACLIPIYHRSYDVAILLPLLAWSAAAARRVPAARGLLALFVVFIVPGGGSLPAVLLARGVFPADWAGTWWWQALVLPFQAWTLVAMGALTVHLLRSQGDVPAAAATASDLGPAL